MGKERYFPSSRAFWSFQKFGNLCDRIFKTFSNPVFLSEFDGLDDGYPLSTLVTHELFGLVVLMVFMMAIMIQRN